MEPVLLTSGAFSKRSRLSPKALRLYEEKGLLTPWTTDSSNGYRYYAESQLDQARLIGLLRRLEMPLKHISEIVSLEATVAMKEIAAYWESVERDLETKRELVHYLDRYLVGKGTPMFEVEVRSVPRRQLATITERHLAADLPRFISDSLEKIYAYLQSEQLETSSPLVMYHGEVNNDADGPIEVCVPFSGHPAPTSNIKIRFEDGGDEAFTRISKRQVDFPGILEAYDAVSQWIETSGRDFRGSPREVYFVDFDAAEPDDPAVDIAFPVA